MPDLLTLEGRKQRAKFRAWHRGTREADFMIGGFFDRYHADWGEAELAWFEALLEENDVDVMAWAMKTQPAPPRFEGDLMRAMQELDYVDIPR
ncbi:succinate dehydrogenase assembly factor 2 [Erythrobacter sp.]|uniref:FAD assembly factor SdhE n=1 Tax=Erythrobacter sp. TaxID=1042 RepID=UPI001B1606D1|nr:succinate dehydrogenase assembly factor 2 [Erythrobacter sp.]MBO6526880.1 succinate dehydrogenase assembly factor 2 [Erythrobacter sp.]MBO6528553.1 succinate dehydrogenase assembly factor 2 [Erythrobacter sp.]